MDTQTVEALMIWGKALRIRWWVFKFLILAIRIDLLDWGVGIRPASRDDPETLLGAGVAVQILVFRFLIARITAKDWDRVRTVGWWKGAARTAHRAERDRAKRRRRGK